MASGPRIFVTGAAGFIGSALVWELNKRGFDNIFLIDRMDESDKWRNLMPLNFTDYIEADNFLNAINLKSEYFGKPDCVFHFGANSSTTEKDVASLIRNNFDYSKHLCSWALRAESRFLYASSAATYGDGSVGMKDNSRQIPTLRPLNAYGFSKQLFDKYILANGLLDYTIGIKFFNIFGPNENHKGDMRSVVAKAYEQIRDKGRLKLFKSHKPKYKDGEQKRDFLYVKDAVNIAVQLSLSASASGIFNVGSGVASSWNELADAIFKAMGKSKKIDYIDMPEHLRTSYQYFTQADIGKLHSVGFKRRATLLEEAVADYVKNYLAKDRRLGDEGLENTGRMPEKKNTPLPGVKKIGFNLEQTVDPKNKKGKTLRREAKVSDNATKS